MADATAILATALNRLTAALDGLDSAIQRRKMRDEASGSRDAELSLMQEDRARLADELDAALARAQRLDSAAAQAQGQIDGAIAAVRAVLDSPAAGA